jgi:hypothetical protein
MCKNPSQCYETSQLLLHLDFQMRDTLSPCPQSKQRLGK